MRIWLPLSSIPRYRAHPGFARRVDRLALLMGRAYPGQVRRMMLPRRGKPGPALTLDDWLTAEEIADGDVPDWHPCSTTAERLAMVRAVAQAMAEIRRDAFALTVGRRFLDQHRGAFEKLRDR